MRSRPDSRFGPLAGPFILHWLVLPPPCGARGRDVAIRILERHPGWELTCDLAATEGLVPGVGPELTATPFIFPTLAFPLVRCDDVDRSKITPARGLLICQTRVFALRRDFSFIQELCIVRLACAEHCGSGRKRKPSFPLQTCDQERRESFF